MTTEIYPGVDSEDDFSLIVYNGTRLNQTLLQLDEDEAGYLSYEERPETYIVPILFAIIFIIGILGNGVLILIFIKHRHMRNVPNMYIVSLAIGDLLVILFCVPFISTVYTIESWHYGLLVCKFSEFTKDISIGVSVFTLTALSADRYFAIVDPMRKLHGGRSATRITCLTITGIWILSFVLALPAVLFSHIKVFQIHPADPTQTINICYPFPEELGDTYPRFNVLFKFLIYYAIPLILIASFYIIMARHLVLSTRNMPGESQSGQGAQIQARKKVAKMVLSFVVIFALCFAPSHIFILWFYFDPNSENNFNAIWNAIRILGFCLSFINSCINPIALFFLSTTFRKYFNQHLFCCFCNAEGESRLRRLGRWARGQSYELDEFTLTPGGRNLGAGRNGNSTFNGRSPTMVGGTSVTNVLLVTPMQTRHPSITPFHNSYINPLDSQNLQNLQNFTPEVMRKVQDIKNEQEQEQGK